MADKTGNNQTDKTDNSFVKIVSIGPLELDLTLVLTEEQITKYNVPDISTINSLSDCKGFLLASNSGREDHNILDQIRLTSSNSSIISLLTINKAFKKKTFIEYLTISETLYEENESFMKEIVKYVTEQNYFFIIENSLHETPSKINFTIKLAESKDTNYKKTFTLNLKSNKLEEPKSSNFFNNLNYNFDFCNYFLFDMNHVFGFISNGLSMDTFCVFIQNITEKNKEVYIVVNYPDIMSNASNLDADSIGAVADILSYTDIFIFDKKEALALFNILSSLNAGDGEEFLEEKKNLEHLFLKEIKKKRKNFPKIGLFFDEMKKLTIIEQQGKTNLILFHSDYELKFIPDKISDLINEEYQKLLVVHHDELKFTLIGGFFSRLFYKKSFNTCFTAGIESAKRILELLRFELDYPIDNNYYQIRIKRQGMKMKNKDVDIMTSRKEQHFVLDCINIVGSKMKAYNPLYDNNLQSFFSSITNRQHLNNVGFINKKGQILQDPDNKKLGLIKNKNLIKIYEEEQKKLVRIRDGNYRMKLQINNLFHGGTSNIHNINLNELEKLSKVFNYHPISGRKLPSLSDTMRNIITKSNKSPSPERNDLYAKAISQNKKDYYLKKSKGKKNFLKPLSKETYLKLLDNYEDKVKTQNTNPIKNNNEEEKEKDKNNNIKTLQSNDFDKNVKKETVVINEIQTEQSITKSERNVIIKSEQSNKIKSEKSNNNIKSDRKTEERENTVRSQNKKITGKQINKNIENIENPKQQTEEISHMTVEAS